MTDELRIGDETIVPGETKRIVLPVAKLYTHSELGMPVQVIRSRTDGPKLFITAAIHGDEINGVEIIRRIMRIISPRKIRGTLIAVPVVNVHGFVSRSRYLPDRRDLNRSFPGSDRGSLAGRIASLLVNEIVYQSTHGIDLHTASVHKDNLPQIRVSLEDPAASEMAKAFRAPVILHSTLRDGSLRREVLSRDIPILVYEGGEALRFNELAIRAGVNGILSVMDHLGMLYRKPNPRSVEPYLAKSSRWIRAQESGLFRSRVALGKRIGTNDVLGYISDPFGDHVTRVRAPEEGIVIGKSQLPLVDEGDALFHVATFRKSEAVEEGLQRFQEDLGASAVYTQSGL